MVGSRPLLGVGHGGSRPWLGVGHGYDMHSGV